MKNMKTQRVREPGGPRAAKPGDKQDKLPPTWLTAVVEATAPPHADWRLWVRSGSVSHGGSTIPHPHRHSFCELSFQFAGEGLLFAGREVVRRRAGDLLLMGAQVPHWYEIRRHPIEFVTIYFFPTVLVNWVSMLESAVLLRRFTAAQPLSARNVTLPGGLRAGVEPVFRAAVVEFHEQAFGWQLRLLTMLVDILTRLARWEQKRGRAPGAERSKVDWERLDRVLRHLRDHFAEPVYGRQLAALTGMCESSLNTMFFAALGMSWVKYLQGLRIQRALALLAESGQTVASVAFAVGFESLSHFNTTFRSLVGAAPTAHLRIQQEFS